jgi:GT2 family glycosyltransferase
MPSVLAGVAPSDVLAPGGRRVSTIVVTYNGRRHIGPCLFSLLATADDAREIVVVDNASTDDTADFVHQEFTSVRLISLGENMGYGGANNDGVAATRSDYVAVVNQDVVSVNDWIARSVAALEADPGAALATPKILRQGTPSRVNACGNAPHYAGITVCRGYGQPSERFDRQEEVAAVSGAAFVIRRSVFEALGGFDPLFFLYLEDTDLSLRAALAGYRCLLVPDGVVLHEFEPRFSPEKVAFLERNRHAMLLKLYCWRTLLALAPALLLTEALVAGYCILRGPRCSMAKLRAYGWVLTRLPLILRRRRQAQALRRVSDRLLLARCTATVDLDELESRLVRTVGALINPLFRAYYHCLRVIVRW